VATPARRDQPARPQPPRRGVRPPGGSARGPGAGGPGPQPGYPVIATR